PLPPPPPPRPPPPLPRDPGAGGPRTGGIWCSSPRAARSPRASPLGAPGRSRTDRRREGRRRAREGEDRETGCEMRDAQLRVAAEPRSPHPASRFPAAPVESPDRHPAAAAVPGIRAPVPARRSRQRLLHRVEDLVGHVPLRKERQLDRVTAPPDDGDAIRGHFESRAGLVRV